MAHPQFQLGLHFAEVEYPSADMHNRMIDFYQATARVPHLEHMYADPNALRRRIKVGPVGVNRMPIDLPELLQCVKNISDALLGLHRARWMHCDVRWSNIIEHFGEWILIDCEYACNSF